MGEKNDRPDENEPLEEVGPSGCDATAELAQRKIQELTQPVQECQWQVWDELAEQFPVEPIPMVPHPVDGLPVPASDGDALALAAPFTIDHVVCVEDDRVLVEMFKEEIEVLALPEALQNSIKARNQYDFDGRELAREQIDPDSPDVQKRWGHRVKVVDGGVVMLRPIRERCQYYKRQVFSNDEVTDEKAYGHRIVFRNCTMRRSVGGAFMSVNNEAVYACDYRSPAHTESVEKYLDNPDRTHLRSGAHLRRLPLFGLEGEARVFRAPPSTEAQPESKGEQP